MALGRIVDQQAGSPFRARPDVLCQSLDFLGFSQHGHRKNLDGIGFLHLGLQFGCQIEKLFDILFDFFLIGLEN
jgi:hypothetical protein